jgi:uncharacterized protein YggU (UPF0235/DUF167 family)
VIRAEARWARVAPSHVTIVSGATARHKLVLIDCEDSLPAPGVWPAAAITGKRTPGS